MNERIVKLTRRYSKLSSTRQVLNRSLFQSDDSDIWDDTALIKAYDKAVASFKVNWGAFWCF